MTGTVTGSKSSGFNGRAYTIDWKSDASGNVLAYLNADLALGLLFGTIEYVLTAPGENGDLTTDLPTASYDITLVDAHAYDWAGGNLANRSGTAAEKYTPTAPPVILAVDLRVKVENAGNAKRGRIIIGVKTL